MGYGRAVFEGCRVGGVTTVKKVMSFPLQPDPLPTSPPIWICPFCQKLMRIQTIEVADREERTNLACAACGTEATQTKVLSE